MKVLVGLKNWVKQTRRDVLLNRNGFMDKMFGLIVPTIKVYYNI